MTSQAAYQKHLDIIASQAESLRNMVEDLREQIEVARKWDNDIDAEHDARRRIVEMVGTTGKITRASSTMLDWIIDVAIEI